MSHLDLMVKLHAYLFRTKMTIRKIPSPATLSQKSSFFLTVSHISRCYSRISIMLAHDPKSSTLCMYVCWFSSSILTVHLKKGRAEGKGWKASNLEYIFLKHLKKIWKSWNILKFLLLQVLHSERLYVIRTSFLLLCCHL